jgi:hypothetical protein
MARPIDHAKEQYWRRVVARWAASRLSIAAFCAEAGLCEQDFYRWRRVLRARSERCNEEPCPRTATPGKRTAHRKAVPLFVPVAVESVPPSAAMLEVVVVGGQVVRVPVGFDAATLAQLLVLLEGGSC